MIYDNKLSLIEKIWVRNTKATCKKCQRIELWRPESHGSMHLTKKKKKNSFVVYKIPIHSLVKFN